jgi:hypothetical protein
MSAPDLTAVKAMLVDALRSQFHTDDHTAVTMADDGTRVHLAPGAAVDANKLASTVTAWFASRPGANTVPDAIPVGYAVLATTQAVEARFPGLAEAQAYIAAQVAEGRHPATLDIAPRWNVADIFGDAED